MQATTPTEIKRNGNVNSSHEVHGGPPGSQHQPYFETKDTVVECTASVGGNGAVCVQPVNLSGGPQRPPKNPFVDPSQRHSSPVDMKGKSN